MRTNEYWSYIYFEDEVPRFGSGWRKVKVREGRKWAHLEDALGRRARLRIGELERLKPRRVECATTAA